MSAPVFTVFAGINGAGKTALYRVLKSEIEGKRINTDEIALSLGNPKDPVTQVHAGKLALEQIKNCINGNESVHVETTLSGNVINKFVTEAREKGFHTVLYYVGIDNVDTVLERVHKRIQNGGHGIDDKFIIQKYHTMTEKLKDLLPLFDIIYLYDNTVSFRQVAVIKDGDMVDCDMRLPCWICELDDND